ncbi:MAG TPA: NYN domain-containing protein [Candidatus Paceibacterota bacterium]|nr:NYN domain-containing protein [Candidatus Paceibacterota bacterium]
MEEFADKKETNVAFIDGQNLHMGTKEEGWSVNYARLRTYLRDKYKINEAYYFFGYVSEDSQDLYDNLQKAGFILSFREHSSAMKGQKKGNVDCDIIFGVMRKLIENEPFDKIYIVSGDGDYKKLVDFLIKKERFGKMLFPNMKFASSLYKKLGGEYFANLGEPDVRSKIAHIHK